MRKQARALLLKAKAHRQRRPKKENHFGAARVARAARDGKARGGARKHVPDMMPCNDVKEQSWEIQYMNQGGLPQDMVGASTPPPKITSPPAPCSSPGAGGAADQPSKLELFKYGRCLKLSDAILERFEYQRWVVSFFWFELWPKIKKSIDPKQLTTSFT